MQEIPELIVLFERFGTALALGLLLGLERERKKGGSFAGIRTFGLISLAGCAAAFINQFFVPFTFLAGFGVISAFVLGAYIKSMKASKEPGITTEVSALLAFLFGGMVWWEMAALAGALTIVVTLLLALKRPLRDISRRIDPREIIGAMEFGIISLIVLPILPDVAYGPFSVLNPRRIWLLVVLIAGVNLVSYALIKVLGSRQGIGIVGFLGGIGSSTAVAMGFSRRSRTEEHLSALLALGIAIASSIMFLRLLVLAWVIHPSVGKALVLPMVLISTVGFLACAAAWFGRLRRLERTEESQADLVTRNPFELWPALQFGLLFAVILFATGAARYYLGTRGVYLSSFLAGIANTDAITLSLASMAHDSVPTEVAARGIFLAGLSNTVAKLLLAVFIGSRKMLLWLLPLFGVLVIAGVAAFFLIG